MNTIEDLRSGHFKNSYGVEGMLLTGDPSQKRIIDVSDEMKNLVFENVKKAYYQYNGMSGDNQAEEEAYHGARNEYYKTLARDDRVPASWTLSKPRAKAGTGGIRGRQGEDTWVERGTADTKRPVRRDFCRREDSSIVTGDIKEVLGKAVGTQGTGDALERREDQILIGQDDAGSADGLKGEDQESEKRSGRVAFNQGKRARQLASAKTAAQVQMVIGLLKKDLSDCEYGVANDMCDENEVAKVKAMLEKAMQRLGEVSNAKESEEQKGGDSFLINMLM